MKIERGTRWKISSQYSSKRRLVTRRITNPQTREREKKTKQTKKQGIERYFEISNRASELRGINECVDEARKQKARSNKHISNQSVSTLVKSVTTNNAVFINKFVEDK